jgi:amidase
MNRREFLAAAGVASQALAPLARAAASDFDPAFGTAASAAAAIRGKQISSFELTKQCFERIAKYNPPLNAIVVQLQEQALERAEKADAAVVSRATLGPLHGVPITVKESFNIAGVPTTWGVKPMENFRPKHNSAVVEKLERAGAIVVGKTNVPVMLSDWQSYNPVYGSSNNPWDVKRTPGGSTGGGAAALAAGLGFLTMGSDIGGSIRIPAHFCGVYGHKPTLELVSLRGHAPPPFDADVRVTSDLSVAGPLARSAGDLREALRIVGGGDGDETVAWRWLLPEPRHHRLGEFRVGLVLDDPICRVSSEVAPVLEAVAAAIEKAGARVDRGWPEGVDPKRSLDSYRYMLGASLFSRLPKDQLDAMRRDFERDPSYPLYQGVFGPHLTWVAHAANQRNLRAAWQHYFHSHDVFLMPVAFVPAFPHDHSDPLQARTLTTPEGKRVYEDMAIWISYATFAGLPATAAPVGKTKSGLPVGVQIVGPLWEDATPIYFAELLADVIGGFERPKGF